MTKRIIFSFLLVLLIIPTVFASLTATIGNPRMVLYHNISSQSEPAIFDNFVIVENKNDFIVNIEISPQGDWKDKVTLYESNFTLAPEVRRTINYTVSISEPGHYRGDVLVIFTGGNETNSLSLAQDLEVFVSPTESYSKSKLSNVVTMLTIIIVLLVILIVLVYVYQSKSSKKSRGVKK